MTKIEFIIIILIILILFKVFHYNENFKSIDTNDLQQDNNNAGIYNYFYSSIINPYLYPMTPFFSNDSQELPKPSPKYSEY